ncbi:MAG: sigma-70 family RNA polymerase sigma factor [Candidatus Rokubacteria bacterium]|nr:sigma-70 family RNA polymerase sigma factor [Candidatus Rokubacteria bacterium]
MATRDWRKEFEDVALVHLDQLYHMALRLCRSPSRAEDLVQETYLRAFRHFDQFDPGTNCRAWLFAILHNTFVNRVKRDSRELLELDEGSLDHAGASSPEVMATIANPEEEFLKHVLDGDLVSALEAMPVTFQEAVLLADVEEFSYKEIAQILGVPVGTVMSRLHRGRQLLRKTLVASSRERKGMRRDA